MEDNDKSFVYNIHLCRICQIPNNLELINTSTTTVYSSETYLDILKFIFNDLSWVEDDLLSVACISCLTKATEIAEFKRLCLNTNLQRERNNLTFLSKLEVDPLKIDEQLKVEEPDEDETEIRTRCLVIKVPESTTIQKPNRNPYEKRTFSERTHAQIKYHQGSEKQIKFERKLISIKFNYEAKERAKSKCHRCHICGEDFKFQCLLERHACRHYGSRNYICMECGQKDIAQRDMEEHMKLHSGEYNYTCDICPKKFKSSSNLQTHKNVVHANPKDSKYLCTECGQRFSGLSEYKEHLNRHKHISKITKKMYECGYCGKSVAFKDKFERHLRKHTYWNETLSMQTL